MVTHLFAEEAQSDDLYLSLSAAVRRWLKVRREACSYLIMTPPTGASHHHLSHLTTGISEQFQVVLHSLNKSYKLNIT